MKEEFLNVLYLFYLDILQVWFLFLYVYTTQFLFFLIRKNFFLFSTPSSRVSRSIPFLFSFFFNFHILRCFLQTSLQPDNANIVSFDIEFWATFQKKKKGMKCKILPFSRVNIWNEKQTVSFFLLQQDLCCLLLSCLSFLRRHPGGCQEQLIPRRIADGVA